MKINYILASLAFVGGLSAAFTNHSVRNNMYPTWKFESERIKGEKINYISAIYLADLLYNKEQGFTLLDIRDKKIYDEYHIPSASRFEKGNQNPDQKEGWFIIYGSMEDTELQVLSDELPGKVFVLKGGISEWYSMVLFPDFIQYQVRNKDNLEQIISRCRYFGGNPKNTQQLNILVRESRYREGC